MALRALIDTNTVIVGELNTTLSPIERSSSQKFNKGTSEQYTFFSAAHGTFSKIDHIFRHKASLNKFKKI
jgi:hypothetical protein